MAVLTPQGFVKRWSASTLSERSSYQQHFLDLCEMIGAPKPAEVDPAGDFYTFEKGVEKTGGGKGFADVWYKDRFAIEYKGKHKDLAAAYGQLLQYRESLENPPLLVVTDTDRFEVHTNFTGTVTEVHSFTNAELPEPENLRVLRAMFWDPYSLMPMRTVQGVTEEAAGKFARLAAGLRGRGVTPSRRRIFSTSSCFACSSRTSGSCRKASSRVWWSGARKGRRPLTATWAASSKRWRRAVSSTSWTYPTSTAACSRTVRPCR